MNNTSLSFTVQGYMTDQQRDVFVSEVTQLVGRYGYALRSVTTNADELDQAMSNARAAAGLEMLDGPTVAYRGMREKQPHIVELEPTTLRPVSDRT